MEKKYHKRIGLQILFPMILFILPLLRCNIGVDITDTGYSLGGFLYQGAQMGEEWVKFATFLATAIGGMLARLPFGDTMIGMNLYTGLFVSATACLSYLFVKKYMAPWIAFLGEILAISLCWCPTIILYNYVTYFLFTVMVICLYKGIVDERKKWLFLAGIVYGFNVMTRIPNITHGALIVALWYAGWLKKKELTYFIRQTLICVAGFMTGFFSILFYIICRYGITPYLSMLHSLFGGNGGVEGHSMSDMLLSIVDAYLVGFKWMSFAILVVLFGIALFFVCREQFLITKRVLYVCVILVLFRFYYGRGMFNLRYYAYESMFQWAVLLLLIAIGTMLLVILSKKADVDQKIMVSMMLLLILVTPLGSDNYLYPNINNLFLVAPVVLYWVIRFVRNGQNPWYVFPIKGMLVAILLMTFIQSFLFGRIFVFRDGMLGEKRDAIITKNSVLKGMHTNQEMADSIDGITVYCEENQLLDKKVILYGNIPALSCYLKMPSAISTSWADLDSYTINTMQKDLQAVQERPIVIVSCSFDAWLTEDAEGMERFQLDPAYYEKDQKAALLKKYLKDQQYKETYLNEKFVIYE